MTGADGDSPWLSDDQQQVWRLFLAVQALLPASLDDQLARDGDLSHTSYIVLALLSEAPQRWLRMSTLAGAVTMSASRVSHAVARLEERGLVRRERAPEDGRGNRAVLTDRGYEVLVAAAPGHAAAVKELVFGGLSAEHLRQFGEVLAIVERRLRADEAGRGAPGRTSSDRPVT
jgi:DNA-binding MarR family transcriptional regulator